MIAWRIHRAALGVGLNGSGGRFASGRWHFKGVPVVYAAGTASLAVLERLVNTSADFLPPDLVLSKIHISEAVKVADVRELAKLPRRWRRLSELPVTRQIGMKWLRSRESAVLAVPSAIVTEELNFIINPVHPDHDRIRLARSRAFRFDDRLFV